MIVRIEAFFYKLRRVFSRSEWMAHLLNLSASDDGPNKPGLVMIQIDGLGFTEFERAMQKGDMPFLSRLARKEGYLNHRHYAGVPSNTPSVQGALFYGVKTCVPAFSFKDHESNHVFNMFQPQSAAAVENCIKDKGKALLEGGSAYGNIFTGGAKEAHFCGASMGWGSVLKAASPLGIPLTVLLNLHIFVRALFLVILEFFLALGDSIRGILSGKNLAVEVGFIPLRVTICVLLREVIAAGVTIDIARGLPIIHANLAGYDEQAHHRGPTSTMAHWTLRGIDSAIERIWTAAARARQRDYDVFIYSDHGQEETIGYFSENGRPLHAAVDEVFQEKITAGGWKTEYSRGVPYWRADLMQNKPGKRLQAAQAAAQSQGDDIPRAIVTAMGPVGHIYAPQPLSAEEKEIYAAKLVQSAKIPIVMVPDGPGKAIAWTAHGRFILPEQADQVIEPQHPFYNDVVRDLVEVCHHPDAGDFLIFGWRPGSPSLTFPREHGSHAGPGVEETSGFALLPMDALARTFGKTLYTHELREAAFRVLGRSDENSFFQSTREATSPILRIMTYNVHSCLGRDGKISPHRIARIIARHNPDVVALQELDTRENMHQAEIIAQKVAMTFQYHYVLSMKKGQRGNAIFSRFPLKPIRNGTLPRLASRIAALEPRGALWVEIDIHGQPVQILNTHLSLFPPEGLLQTEALLGADWLGNPSCQGPVIFCGDFNAYPDSKIYKRLAKKFRDAQCDISGHCVLNTLPSFLPFKLVDYIFVSPGLKTLKAAVPRTALEKVASDHLPLIVDVELNINKF